LRFSGGDTPRTLIEPHKGDKRCVRRKAGRFTEKQVGVGRSLAAGPLRQVKKRSPKTAKAIGEIRSAAAK
jgi:hypothetical protein